MPIQAKLSKLEKRKTELEKQINLESNLYLLADSVGLEPYIVYPDSNLYGAIGGLGFKHDKHGIKEVLEKLPPVERTKLVSTFLYDIPSSYLPELIAIGKAKESDLETRSFTYEGPKLEVRGYNTLSWYSLIDGQLVNVKFCLCGYSNHKMPHRYENQDSRTKVQQPYIYSQMPDYKIASYYTGYSHYYCFSTVNEFLEFANSRNLV